MSTQKTADQQRANARVPADGHVWLQCRLTADGPDVANGVLDISASGIQFLAKQPLGRGDAVHIVLNASGAVSPIRRQGEVRWVVALGADACFAGVQFQEPLSADQWRMI